MNTREPMLSVRSAARVIGIDRATLTSWIYRGYRIRRWIRTPTGRFRIPVSEAKRLHDQHTREEIGRIGSANPANSTHIFTAPPENS